MNSICARLSIAASMLVAAAACLEEHPQSEVEVQGPEVKWGKDFTVAQQQATSQPAMPNDGLHGGAMATGTGPGSVPPTGAWEGGDPVRGRAVFTAQCTPCHGDGSQARNLDGGVQAPALADSAARLSSRDIAKHIAHGHGGMPSFMGKLDRQGLLDVIAAVRALAPQGEATPSSQPSSAPAD